jgi:RNA polymerase sigma-70 factor, ECF subfamily
MAVVVDDNAEFEHLVGRFRRDLLTYCYLMVGSKRDAEDLVDEVLLRARRSYPTADRSNLKIWLFRIATDACDDPTWRGPH